MKRNPRLFQQLMVSLVLGLVVAFGYVQVFSHEIDWHSCVEATDDFATEPAADCKDWLAKWRRKHQDRTVVSIAYEKSNDSDKAMHIVHRDSGKWPLLFAFVPFVVLAIVAAARQGRDEVEEARAR